MFKFLLYMFLVEMVVVLMLGIGSMSVELYK